MHYQRQICAITNAMIIAFVSQGQASGQAPAVSQFGHSSHWKYASEWPASMTFHQPTSTEIGSGRAQIVSDDKMLFVASGSNTRDGESKITGVTTSIKAYIADDSEMHQQWSYILDSKLRGDQQTFGGADATPQSTPLVIGRKLIILSFTGQLVCLDSERGKQLWSKDLVEEYSAVPVQFGFSSSPVVDPVEDERVVVLAAGERGGLLNLNAVDGSLNWRSECTTFSYATPVIASFGGVDQWVVVSEDHLIGIGAADGKRLWQYELPETGLTNVPSPLVVNDSELLVAGQGCNGVRCLKIASKGTVWRVEERWHQPKADFFYTNWMMLDEHTVIGSTRGFLAAIDTRTGNFVGRWRGFSDGNLVRVGSRILLLDGKGKLTVFEPGSTNGSPQTNATKLNANMQVNLPAGRYWTAPSIVDEQLLVRSGSQLLSIGLSRSQRSKGLEGNPTLANELREPQTLDLTREKVAALTDPVGLIFDTFENQGQAAALKQYAELRATGKLNATHRIDLAATASQQSFGSLAIMILEHAIEDMPGDSEIKAALAKLRK